MIVRLPIVLFTGQPHYFYLHCYLLHLLSSSLFVGRGSVCALFVSHPCETLDTHAKASLPPYERSVGFASCKAFGRSFQASLPCLPLPLHQPPSLPQALRTACQALKIIPDFNGFCALQYHTKSNQLIHKNHFLKKWKSQQSPP